MLLRELEKPSLIKLLRTNFSKPFPSLESPVAVIVLIQAKSGSISVFAFSGSQPRKTLRSSKKTEFLLPQIRLVQLTDRAVFLTQDAVERLD